MSKLADEKKDNTIYFDFLNKHAKNEFERIYRQDETFTLLNKQSILTMFRLNISHRFIAFHQFGINIEF